MPIASSRSLQRRKALCEEEINQAAQAMEPIIDQYGSLTNGLHHYVADFRNKQTNS